MSEPDDPASNERGAELRFSPRLNRAHEIRWRPWGAAAFEDARRLGRPVLLSLSAVWCHWCHVMDETTYSDPEVIRLVNERYVPLRVDNDRRPDINRRYNMGGWPTTAFLTSSGAVLTGATYLPVEHMLDALRRVDVYYQQHREELEKSAAAGGGEAGRADLAAPGGSWPTAPPGEGIRPEAVDWVRQQIVDAFDPLHGGFGTQPKFPQADALALLLLRSATCQDERVDAVLVKTLDAMAGGAVYDRVEDGFFRYATRRDWSEPHYEKMLEDNARLLRVYAEASAVLGDAAYAGTARGVARYLLTALWQPALGAFAGSQDADEQYYSLSAEGRRSLEPPFIDRTVYTDWNALAASGLLRAAQLLSQPELAAPALTALDTLWERAHRRHGMAHYLTVRTDASGDAPPTSTSSGASLEAAPVDGLLGDQAQMMAALLDAYEHTGERAYLARAEVLAEWVARHLSTLDGGVVDRLPSADAARLAPAAPDLGEASLLADSLLRLAIYSGESHYRDRAVGLLASLQTQYRRYGLMAASFAAAVQRAVEPPVHVVVVGAAAEGQTQALLSAAVGLSAPQRTAQVLDPDVDLEHIVRDGYSYQGRAAAYVCLGSTCLPPVYEPADVARAATGRHPGTARP